MALLWLWAMPWGWALPCSTCLRPCWTTSWPAQLLAMRRCCSWSWTCSGAPASCVCRVAAQHACCACKVGLCMPARSARAVYRVAGLFVVARMKTTVQAATKAHVQHIALQQTRSTALSRLAAKLGGDAKDKLSVRPL